MPEVSDDPHFPEIDQGVIPPKPSSSSDSTDSELVDQGIQEGDSLSNLNHSTRYFENLERGDVITKESDKPDVDHMVDKLKKWSENREIEAQKDDFPACMEGGMTAKCENGHRTFLACRCKKEWCPGCGSRGGYLNTQRYNRWRGKAGKLWKLANNVHSEKERNSLAYWIVTWPTEIHEKLKDPDVLGELQKKVSKLFSDDLGYVSGVLSCWHWQGEGGDNVFWKPHLNLLVSDDHIEKEKFLALKNYLKVKIAQITNDVLGTHYHASKFNPRCELKHSEAAAGHTVSYVVRPTLRLGIDIDKPWDGLSQFQINQRYKKIWNEVLKGFMNYRVYGHIRGVSTPERGNICCEVCGEDFEDFAWANNEWIEVSMMFCIRRDQEISTSPGRRRDPPDD